MLQRMMRLTTRIRIFQSTASTRVVLALIHANPNAVNRRCNRRVVHLRMHTVLAAQGRSLSRKQSSRQREKVFLSRWAKSRRDVNKGLPRKQVQSRPAPS